MTNTDAVQNNGPSESGEGRAWPILHLKLKDYFHPDCGDAYYFGWAASRLHVGIRIENMADYDAMCLEVTLYEEVPLIDCEDTEGWWPLPRGGPHALTRLSTRTTSGMLSRTVDGRPIRGGRTCSTCDTCPAAAGCRGRDTP